MAAVEEREEVNPHVEDANLNALQTDFVDLEEGHIDEYLVEEVKKYRILWDTSARGYKDTIKKKQAWNEVSTRLSLSQNSDLLKRRWKNLRDGMMRCLKKISEPQKSGASASKTPTCKLFDQLLFLRDFVSNRETSSNIILVNESAVTVDDQISEKSSAQPQPCEESLPQNLRSSVPNSNKRSLEVNDNAENKTPCGRLNKRADRQEKIDLLLVNALTKSDDLSKDSSAPRSSNQFFCESIVEILDKLSSKNNRLARVEIQQVLLKYEFDDDW